LVLPKYIRKPAKNKQLVGVDLFVHWNGLEANQLAKKMENVSLESNELSMITNRGVMVWPKGFKETFCTDHWRCRFVSKGGSTFTKKDIVQMLFHATEKDIDVIKTENLYEFDGKAAYSLGQGQ
jgi:isocitrate dehydrogenase